MAFMSVPPDYGYKIASLFGTSQDLIATAKKNGVTIKQPQAGTFVVHSPSGAVAAKFDVATKVISLAQNNTLGPSSLQGIEDKFSSGIKKALAMGKTEIQKTAIENNYSTGVDFGALVKDAFNPGSPVHAPVVKTGSGEAVNLKNAGTIGQVVGSTSPGSKYIYFAQHQSGLKFALRLKDSQLSIRCEGPSASLLKHSETLKDGLSFDVYADYASIHVKCPKPYQSLKVLGCLVSLLGVSQFTQLAAFQEALQMSVNNAA